VKIDIHAHFFPLLDRAQAAMLERADAPWLRDDGDGTGFIMAGDREYRPVEAALWDGAARLAEMDAHGVDLQVVCVTPILFNYGDDPRRISRWAAMVNDLALEMCSVDPARLLPLCQVPLQDLEAACKEVTRARDAGHVGVQIGNHVNGRNLDDPEIERFLHHCGAEGVAVFVHPWETMAADRMRNYMLPWLVGMPAETHLAILSLILSGGFERLPTDLRICFAHGGGGFAGQLGRVDNAWHRRDLVRADCPNPPSSYTDRFSVDSAVFDDDALRLLVAVMGEDRVILGSDFPFPLGESHPGRLIEESAHLSSRARSALLHRNAERFFDLTPAV
jgi:aminocarboxymuconate-semialdehyde decarboxylase